MGLDHLQHEHLSTLLAALRAIPDPEARIRAIDAALGTVLLTQSALAELRKDAIRDMLNTMSKSEVGRRLGITRARVGQLAGTGMHYPARHKRVTTTEETT